QILLVRRKIEPGALLQEDAQELVIRRGHDRSPENRRTILVAIWFKGRMAEQMPALAAAPGMPHTTLVASSCAITLPPAATISLPPRVPSDPMPVRITARMPPRQISIAEVKSGSTAGLQKFTAGPLSSAITASAPLRTTRMCLPPGAR